MYRKSQNLNALEYARYISERTFNTKCDEKEKTTDVFVIVDVISEDIII